MPKFVPLTQSGRVLPAAVLLLACFLGAFTFKPSAVVWTNGKTYDFGSVELGSTTGVVFTFTNVSPDSIVLQTVRTTCGCTAAQWPERPVAPGANADIRIEYSAENKGGFSKKIRVFFDAMRKPEILTIYGVVE